MPHKVLKTVGLSASSYVQLMVHVRLVALGADCVLVFELDDSEQSGP